MLYFPIEKQFRLGSFFIRQMSYCITKFFIRILFYPKIKKNENYQINPNRASTLFYGFFSVTTEFNCGFKINQYFLFQN